jgi:aspartate/glutamate racemase/prolyl-tRNA editing enzyme YbaK/EbsC (Cys-tRNA(Pro) deacylase)
MVIEKMEHLNRYTNFNHLLKDDEKGLPEGVKKVIDFFDSNRLWFQLSRNLPAGNCRDAVNKRTRLGHTGIPLGHELKSFLGKFTNSKGNKQFIALHCRGNQELDFEKVNRTLNAKIGVSRLTDRELNRFMSTAFGLVNPFSIDGKNSKIPIIQVFDKSLERNNISPYTMMTNAGDLKWAIEFKPAQIISAIKNSLIEDIVINSDWKQLNTEQKSVKIGIITGNAPESGILLWKQINQRVREKLNSNFLGDISFPHVIVESIPDMGLSMELDSREEETWEVLKSGIVSLCNQGVEILCIACNTTQYFTPAIQEITSGYGVKFISIPDVTLAYLENEKIKEFAFLGVKYVTDLENDWSAFKALRKFKVETLSEKDLEMIHELAFNVKTDGITGTGINHLRDLLDNTTHLQNIVVALTEISILLENQKNKSKKGRNYIDTLDILADAVANEYLRIKENV